MRLKYVTSIKRQHNIFQTSPKRIPGRNRRDNSQKKISAFIKICKRKKSGQLGHEERD
jgi:hypothetical protein